MEKNFIKLQVNMKIVIHNTGNLKSVIIIGVQYIMNLEINENGLSFYQKKVEKLGYILQLNQ